MDSHLPMDYMDPLLNSGFQNLQFSPPNIQIQNVPGPMIPPISNDLSIHMNEADDMIQSFNSYKTIPRQDYQINPNFILNPYNQNQKKENIKPQPQTSDYGLPYLQEHGQDYKEIENNLGPCSKKKDCFQAHKECNGCQRCDCANKICKVIGTLSIIDHMSCKVGRDCQKYCQCSDGLKPNLCKCTKVTGLHYKVCRQIKSHINRHQYYWE